MLHDFRFALRSLARTPAFTLVSVLMLAVGIGLSIYMFGAINAFALKPLPFAQADRLVHFQYTERGNRERNLALPQADWLDLRARQTTLQSLAGYYQGTMNLGGLDAPPERLSGAWVSPDAFGTLGIKPVIGRDFTAGDAAAGATRVALIGMRTWQLQFNADPKVIGRHARINGADVEVIGVMPERFAFPIAESLWLPLSLDRASADGDEPMVKTFGRLRDGVSIAQAQSQFDGLIGTLSAERGKPLRGDSAKVEPFADEFILPQIRQGTTAMSIAVLLVLLIACANVASLTLARFSVRTRELGVRSALGASRRRLVGQVLAETLLVAIAATVLGYLATTWWVRSGEGTDSMAGNLPYWVDFHGDIRDALFAAVIAFGAALLAGLAPALRSSRLDVQASLSAGGNAGLGNTRGPGRFLVSAEVALGVILLIGAGVAIRSALDAQSSELGIRTQGILTGRIALSESDYPDAAARERFARELERKLGALPGVESTAIASTLPLMGYERQEYAKVGDAVADDTRLPQAWSTRVNDRFFDTFGVALREGRLFDARDRADATPVAIVSAAFAERAWPGQSAIGQRVRLQPKENHKPWMEVVGVVADSVQSDYIQTDVTNPAHRGDGNVYRPLAQDPAAFVSFALRAGGDVGALGESVRATVRSIDANLPVYWLRPMEEWRARIFWGTDLLAHMFGAFAVFAVLLAAAGIYAVLAFDVTRRTREIGVRRALGAPAGSVLAMVLRRGGKQVAIGLAIGLPLAFAFTAMLAQMLMPGSRTDPLVYLAVIAVLGIAVLLAAWLPARRALRVDPMVALRNE
jgi:predicted permease